MINETGTATFLAYSFAAYLDESAKHAAKTRVFIRAREALKKQDPKREINQPKQEIQVY